jgi:hypothetical protein
MGRLGCYRRIFGGDGFQQIPGHVQVFKYLGSHVCGEEP